MIINNKQCDDDHKDGDKCVMTFDDKNENTDKCIGEKRIIVTSECYCIIIIIY